MRSRNTRFQPSWLCRLVVGGLRSSHILEGQVLKESATDISLLRQACLRLKQVCELGSLSLLP